MLGIIFVSLILIALILVLDSEKSGQTVIPLQRLVWAKYINVSVPILFLFWLICLAIYL
jgi:hypothetical protein